MKGLDDGLSCLMTEKKGLQYPVSTKIEHGEAPTQAVTNKGWFDEQWIAVEQIGPTAHLEHFHLELNSTAAFRRKLARVSECH